MPSHDNDDQNVKPEHKESSPISLHDKVKHYVQTWDNRRFIIEEFPLAEWNVSANNLATRLSEYHKERPQWIECQYRTGKNYKEWFSVKKGQQSFGI